MTTALILCGIFAFYHLMYENLIAPTFRMKLRFRLFALRDEVRLLCAHSKSDSERATIQDMEAILNNAIRLLHTATIFRIWSVEAEFRQNIELQKKTERRTAAITAIPELETIRKKTVAIVTQGFMVNSGGWFLYLIPVLLAVISWAALRKCLNSLVTLREYEWDSLSPETACAR